MSSFIKFSDSTVKPVQNDTTKVTVSGDPRHTAWVHFQGNDGAFRSGVWESTAGVFNGPMNDQIEFCHILEGKATIVVGDESFDVKAGDSFVMDNGLQPVWHVEEYVRKSFVIAVVPPATS